LTKARGIHTLRHCFATHQLYQGTDIFVLQKMMGHAYITTTAQYLHLVPGQTASPKSPLDQE
jgi:site-specific recombinase XerD